MKRSKSIFVSGKIDDTQETLISLASKNEGFIRRSILFLFIFLGTVLLVGILTYQRISNWSALDAFYFSIVTLGTVGKCSFNY